MVLKLNYHRHLFLILIVLNLSQTKVYVHGLLPPPFGGSGLDKGFNILETTSKVLPQGKLVKTAKNSWTFVWKRFMAELAPQSKSGSYERPSYKSNGSIGESNTFPDDAGRYHLYVGNPCPWCHRAKLVVALKKFTSDQIGMTSLVDDPVRASRGGWVFDGDSKGDEYKDPLGSYDLRELYEKVSPGYKGRCTAPLLVDLKTKQIVSNESSDIVRMLNRVALPSSTTANAPGDATVPDLYPTELAAQIDETNEWVYKLLNNGVYRCGFSTQQGAYDAASADVKRGLKKAEDVLSKNNYLCGDVFTEADLRLLPTILRFDGAYSPLFRAGGVNHRVRDYPHVLAWLQRCWDMEDGVVRETIDIDDAVSSYYRQLFPLNPGGLIPTAFSEEDIGLKPRMP